MEQQDEGASGLKRRMGIRAGKGFAFVSHTGEVFPSGFLPKSAGSVREESVVDIYRDSPLFQQLRDDDALTGKCGACRYRTVCGVVGRERTRRPGTRWRRTRCVTTGRTGSRDRILTRTEEIEEDFSHRFERASPASKEVSQTT